MPRAIALRSALTTTGLRAVLSSQQPRTDQSEQIGSTLQLQSHPLRAEDGSRPAPSLVAVSVNSSAERRSPNRRGRVGFWITPVQRPALRGSKKPDAFHAS